MIWKFHLFFQPPSPMIVSKWSSSKLVLMHFLQPPTITHRKQYKSSLIRVFSIKNLNPLFCVFCNWQYSCSNGFIITGHYPELAIMVFGIMVFSPCLYFRKVSSWFLNALLPTLNINICHHHEQNISVSAVSSSISVSSHKHSTECHGCNWWWFWQKNKLNTFAILFQLMHHSSENF